MTSRILVAVLVAGSLSGVAHAHFVLIQPAASMVQDRLGDPQKIAPCGGVSANPARGSLANPGVPSGAVTSVKGGTDLPLLVHESIFHPGHYRVALARTASQLPPDPVVTTAQTERGVRSQSAVIQNPPVAPVLLDGIFAHTERPMRLMADILRRGGDAAEIMGLLAAEARSSGRNDPCPCGSGKKFKNCHGA